MDSETIKEWRSMIIENSQIVNSEINIDIITADPDDNKFLEAALAGNTQYIVSQDKHLLNLKVYNDTKIITPEEFLKIFQ